MLRNVREGVARVTPAWIAVQVEAAILQSAPERAVAEAAAGGTDAIMVHRPPRPAAA